MGRKNFTFKIKDVQILVNQALENIITVLALWSKWFDTVSNNGTYKISNLQVRLLPNPVLTTTSETVIVSLKHLIILYPKLMGYLATCRSHRKNSLKHLRIRATFSCLARLLMRPLPRTFPFVPRQDQHLSRIRTHEPI